MCHARNCGDWPPPPPRDPHGARSNTAQVRRRYRPAAGPGVALVSGRALDARRAPRARRSHRAGGAARAGVAVTALPAARAGSIRAQEGNGKPPRVGKARGKGVPSGLGLLWVRGGLRARRKDHAERDRRRRGKVRPVWRRRGTLRAYFAAGASWKNAEIDFLGRARGVAGK
jgi:hypothetical protein